MSNKQKKVIVARENLGFLYVGTSVKKYKRGEWQESFQYLNRKQFAKYKKKLEQQPKTEKANSLDLSVKHFFKVSKYKEKTNCAIKINGDLFDAFEKKKFLHKEVGYVLTTDNEIAAIVRNRFLILIPLLIMLLVLFLSLSFCNKDTDTKPWVPDIDSTIGELTTEAPTSKSHGITMDGFTKWHIPVGQTENLKIPLKNPEGNPCYFTFEIILSNTGETIYESKMVPPGESINQITISKGLDIGTYPAVIKIKTNELETGREMNGLEMKIEIDVS